MERKRCQTIWVVVLAATLVMIVALMGANVLPTAAPPALAAGETVQDYHAGR